MCLLEGARWTLPLQNDPARSSAQKRLVEMLKRTDLSMLTAHNRLEILQNASEKYPRLEEDIRRTKHSITCSTSSGRQMNTCSVSEIC